jgi:glycosyltransferase involved in cell wall biosynthesis
MRVLLIAEACNPEWVSVPLEGWSHAEALRKVTDAHLVTQVRNRAAIERAGLVHGRDFTAIDSEKVARPISGLAGKFTGGRNRGWTMLMAAQAITYPYFERLVWRQFGDAIRRREYDIVHRLTPLSPTVSSSLARRCRRAGVPFVLGPLNGGVPWPKGFEAARRQEREWLSYVRGLYRLLPGFHSTRRNAAALLIGSSDTWEQMPARYREKCVYVAENAIDPARFTARRERRATNPLRAVFVGRLVPYKGADMLLEAAAPLLRAVRLELTIIGDGPQRAELEALIARENIAGGVHLAGFVEHRRLQDVLAGMDVLTFPSIREFGGAVVLEAMAVGVVPVVVAYGGPAELVTPATGFPIEIGPREQIIARFRQTLETLVANPELIDQKSSLAMRRAREQFTWDAKAAQVLQVYQALMDGTGSLPRFERPLPDFA